MAKTFTRKRSTAKGRHGKKKVTGRAAKKTGGVSAVKMKILVAGEVQKVLNSGAHNERRKVTLELKLLDTNGEANPGRDYIFVNGIASQNNFIRIPITEAIPVQQGAGQGPDVRRRRSNKIIITGVNVRASFSASEETRVMFLPYEPHESVGRHLSTIPLVTSPDAREGKVPEGFTTTMVPFQISGIVSEHGPLMTKKKGKTIALDTADDTPFESRVSTHAGKPIGAVVRKKFGGGSLRRTQNWNQGGSVQVGAGYTAWTTHMVNEYWKLNRECTYAYEEQSNQVFERSVEMLMYVDCPSLASQHIPAKGQEAGGIDVVGAAIRKVIVDIYFHEK